MSIRTVQLALALAYTGITLAALRRGGEPADILFAVLMFGVGFVMSKPLPAVSVKLHPHPFILFCTPIVIMLLLMVWIARENYVGPVICGAFCAGNRARAGGLGPKQPIL